MKKFTAAAVFAAAALSLTACPAVSAETDTLCIMCIGDSITDGYGIAGSYRKFLYHGLTEDGYTVEMTGDSSENQGYLSTYTADDGTGFQYDDDHSGHSGFSIVSYSGRSGIYEQIQSTDCIAKYQPKIVILQIGTNDCIDNHALSDAGTRLKTLIGYILGEMPADAALLVTEIPDVQPNREGVRAWFNNYRYSETWQEYPDEETAARVKAGFDLYNSILCETVTEMQQQHGNLYLCHVNRTLTDLDAQLADGVHPNNAGYARMGSYWTETVEQYLAGQLAQEPAAQTETTAAVIPQDVRGDIDGDGTCGLADAVLLVKHLVRAEALPDAQLARADLDGNSRVNAADLTLLKREMM